ncbi:MAG: peptidyl-prolyl cis-trans isomerase [Coraliomargaritaceae bacterium]
MISWIQNHLIRHGRWIFISLLVIIVVAFVFTIGNTPGCTTNRSNYVSEEFFGYDLNSPLDQQTLGQKVNLGQLLTTGRPVQNNQQYAQLVPQRIALLYLADQIGVPAPSMEALGEYLRNRPIFFGPEGQFSAEAFTRFSDTIESNPEMPDDIIAVVLEENYRIEQVRSVLGGPGFVLPDEVRVQTELNKTSYKLATASLKYADFKPEIAEDEEVLKAYYETNQNAYEIPERQQASLVFFSSSNYLKAEVNAEESALRDHFITNRARFVADYEAANPQPEPANKESAEKDAGESQEAPTVTFELVKDAVSADYAEKLAEDAANEAAQTFAFSLYDQAVERDSEALTALLEKNKLTLQTVQPFSLEDANKSPLPAAMLQEAFSLGSNRYYTSVYPIEGGYCLLFTDGRVAPAIPPFESVADRVAADYTAERKRELFNAEGIRLKEALESRLGEGENFAEASAALGMEATAFEPFEYGQPPNEMDRSALERASQLGDGEVSSMITTRDQTGLFVYVEEKTAPEIAPDDEDYASAEDWLQRYSAFIGEMSLTRELINQGGKQP